VDGNPTYEEAKMTKRLVAIVAVTAAVGSVAVAALVLGGASADASVAPGERATIEGLTWSVAEAKQRRRIAIPEGLTYTAQKGMYLIVELRLENASGGAARAVGEYISLVDAGGKRYQLDEDGSNAYHLTLGPHRHDPALYEPMRPDPVFGFFDVPTGTTRAGSVTFDLPRSALRGTPRLEVRPPDGSVTAFELEL
jgi:hypothetical protein